MVNTETKLIKNLPRKWDDILAQMFNGIYTKSHIRNVVSGNRNNIEILESAISLAQQYQNKLKSIKDKIENLN